MESRELQILKILNDKKRLCSYTELSKYLNVSQRLVRYSVKNICSVFTKLNHNVIISVHGKGITLSDIAFEEFNKYYELLNSHQNPTFLSKDDRELMIFFMILNSEYKCTNGFFQEYFDVSKSSIDYDMREVRKYAKISDIEIVCSPNLGFQFQGDEFSIRLMIINKITLNFDLSKIIAGDIINLLTKKDMLVTQYLNLANISVFISNLTSYFIIGNKDNNDQYFNQMVLYIALWKKRCDEKMDISNHYKYKRSFENLHLKQLVDKISEDLNLSYVSVSEKSYLYCMLNSLNFKRDCGVDDNWLKSQILTIRLINNLTDKTGYSYINDDRLFANLSSHINYLLKRLDEGIKIYNPLCEMVMDEYKELFNNIKISCNEIGVLFKQNISDEEIAYLLIHFKSSEEKKTVLEGSKFKVALLCVHGIATTELLIERLNNKYDFKSIYRLNLSEIQNIRNIDIDFVIKTSDINIRDVASVKISPLLNQEDQQLIEKFINESEIISKENDSHEEKYAVLFEDIKKIVFDVIEKDEQNAIENELMKLFQRNNINIKVKGRQPMISEILDDQSIQLNLNVESWQQAIIKSSEPLINKNIITPDYVEAMINTVNEFGPYIVIAPHLALAHASSFSGVNELGLSVATFSPQVKFSHEDNDPVGIVFCLAATSGNSHLKIISTLVKLINEEGKIEELIKQKEISKFKEILFNLE